MSMKKMICALATVAALSLSGTASANPSCVLMKFTDDTRFDLIESTGTLSDLLMEKLLNSGKFNFKETRVIPTDMENLLYDEKAALAQNVRSAVRSGSFNALFEGAGFNDKLAESIAAAQVGQIVSPEIVRSIGTQHGAEYLIQGTILNLGTGDWMNDKANKIVNAANMATSLTGSAGLANMLGPLGPLASMVSIKETGVGVQADIKLIRADTGEVVWKKEVIAKNMQKQIGLGFVKLGSDKLNDEMYYKAMDGAAQKLADALIADLDAGTLFAK